MDSSFIDLYCERTSLSLLGEPLNLVSNMAFIFCGLWLLTLFILSPKRPSYLSLFLSLNIIGIGIGSTVFHALALKWSLWADVLPIFLFILVYFYWVNSQILKLKTGQNICIVFIFLALSLALEFQPLATPLGSSLPYLPAYLVLLSFAWLLKIKTQVQSFFQVSFLIFTFALIARTLDLHLCPAFPLGTHFIWHILNALCLYILTQLSFKCDHGLKA